MQAELSKHIIDSLRRQLISRRLISVSMTAAASTVIICSLLTLWMNLNYWLAIPIFTVILLLHLLITKPWKISAWDISRFLNSQFPELEESSQLALQPYDQLGMLQQMQLEKITTVLQHIPTPRQFNRGLIRGSYLFFAAVITSVCLIFFIHPNKKITTAIPGSINNMPMIVPEQKPAGIAKATISIAPPAYTRKPIRTQEQFSIVAEQDAIITWEIITTSPAKKLELLFNNKSSLSFVPPKDHQHWTVSSKLIKSGFYQLLIDSIRSELYKAEIIPDQPASIRIISPKQYTSIEPGQRREVLLKVSISDDYGIKNAVINATKASGKGEGVSFKEQQLSFGVSISNQRQLELSKTLNLRNLDMHPGDELYFYIKAVDNRGAESRSDMYYISLADTAELMSMSGLTSSVNLVPEYFRSQRQIIIDTEKLLAEKNSISDEEFKNRSNNLGIDQKLLRLRYGKFLGEENETNIGAGHDDDDDHDGSHEETNSVESIMDQYAHKHDIAEDATFFNPDQKKQLKATLTEMWNAELQLRSFTPQQALPFEYKALRLLKDLQQKSRAYVAKTAAKMPPLKEEKRLTGDLNKINNPITKRHSKADEERQHLQLAVSTLESLKYGNRPTDKDRVRLYDAENIIAKSASANPTRFLASLNSIRKLAEGKSPLQLNDIATVEAALQQLIEAEEPLPQADKRGASPALSDLYFKHLQNRPQ